MTRTWGQMAVVAALALGLVGASASAADTCESTCDEDVTACQDICKTYKGKKGAVTQKCMKLCADTKKRCMEKRCASKEKPAAPAPGTQPGGGAQ